MCGVDSRWVMAVAGYRIEETVDVVARIVDVAAAAAVVVVVVLVGVDLVLNFVDSMYSTPVVNNGYEIDIVFDSFVAVVAAVVAVVVADDVCAVLVVHTDHSGDTVWYDQQLDDLLDCTVNYSDLSRDCRSGWPLLSNSACHRMVLMHHQMAMKSLLMP